MKRLLYIFVLIPYFINAQIISTVAGGGVVHCNNCPATSTTINDGVGMAVDSKGNLYIAEQTGFDIRRVDTLGTITVYAGTGAMGYGGDGGPATNALFNQPNGMTVDSNDNLYVADGVNCRIRKIDPVTGIITTICGNGTIGASGDGGPASSATLYYPNSVIFDKHWNLYIACTDNGTIRKINASGIITTIAGTGVFGDTGDGGLATNAEIEPSNLTFDDTGNIYLSNDEYSVVRKINTSGIISRYAGDSGQYLYNGDGIPAINAHFESAWVASSSTGIVYIADHWNNRVRMIDSSGVIHTVAGNGISGSSGDGGLADTAEVYWPAGVAFDNCGNLYIAQIDQPRIRKVAFNPTCSPLKVPEIITSEFLIYPNPASDVLHIDGVKTDTKYVILNITGIIEQTGSLREGSNSIDVRALASGLYMLSLSPALSEGEGVQTVYKIIKE